MTGLTHMRREIGEIPAATERLLAEAAGELAAAGSRIRALDPPYLATIARGSSDHAAAFLKYSIELTARVPVASLGPSIASIYGVDLRLNGAAAIAISQSGKSPDIVAMAASAKAGGALTIAITNTASSPLAEGADCPIDIRSGVEQSVAATKTFVASAVAGLAVLGHWLHDETLLAALADLPRHLDAAIGCDWSALADAVDGEPSLFILGRGPSAAIAQEAALKFKETCSVHAEAYSAAEVMHGPMALVQGGFPVLALAARDRSEASMLDSANALAGKGARAFITARSSGAAVELPHVATGHPLTEPLALVVSFYTFVEAFARRRGLNPDKPLHLRKVTETQ